VTAAKPLLRQNSEMRKDRVTEALENAGYYSQDDNDLLCVLAPSTKVGIPVNNIPSFRKKLGEQTFGQMEASLPRHARKVAT